MLVLPRDLQSRRARNTSENLLLRFVVAQLGAPRNSKLRLPDGADASSNHMEFVPSSIGRREGSPTVASRVRPGGALCFSEPMSYSPSKGGWIADSQGGMWSPGRPELNRNLKFEPAPAPAELIDEEAKCAPPGKSCCHRVHLHRTP